MFILPLLFPAKVSKILSLPEDSCRELIQKSLREVLLLVAVNINLNFALAEENSVLIETHNLKNRSEMSSKLG